MLRRVVRAKTLSNHMSFILPSLLFAPLDSSIPDHWGSMVGILMREREGTL